MKTSINIMQQFTAPAIQVAGNGIAFKNEGRDYDPPRMF